MSPRKFAARAHTTLDFNPIGVVACEWSVMESSAEGGVFAILSRRACFLKPRMYGMTGGRGPVSKSVER